MKSARTPDRTPVALVDLTHRDIHTKARSDRHDAELASVFGGPRPNQPRPCSWQVANPEARQVRWLTLAVHPASVQGHVRRPAPEGAEADTRPPRSEATGAVVLTYADAVGG